MKLLKILLAFLVVSFSLSTFAATKDISNVKVSAISVYPEAGAIHISVTPIPDISGLSCVSPYWVVLDVNGVLYKEALSLLITAQATQNNITMTMDDSKGGSYCYVTKINTLVD